MTNKILFSVLFAGLLSLQPILAEDPRPEENFEPFRDELTTYVDELKTLPPELLKLVYEEPEALEEVRQRVSEMSVEQLAGLKNAMRQIPYWESLPRILAGSFAGHPAANGLDLSAAFEALRPAQDPAALRDNWVGFLDRLSELPRRDTGKEFRQRVRRVRKQMTNMSDEELRELQIAMKPHIPRWRGQMRERALHEGLIGPNIIDRVRVGGKSWSDRFGTRTEEDASSSVSEPGSDSGQQPTSLGGGSGHVDLELRNLVEEPMTTPAGCPDGLPGVLCEIGNIFDSIVSLPSEVYEFAVDALDEILNFLSPIVDIPDDAAELIALMGIDLNDPNWFMSVVEQIPPLRPPCPEDGTFIPGLGEVGTARATLTCKRSIGWVSSAIYQNAPEDIWGVPAKLALALLYYPIDYLCMCFDEASSVRFDDLQAAHRVLNDQRLDVEVTTRASQASVDTAKAAVAGINSDVLAAQGGLAVVSGTANTLIDTETAQSEFLAAFRLAALRTRIEANLLQTGNDDRVSLFQLPEVAGGFLELVQIVVENTVQSRIDAGRDIGWAPEQIYQGDLDYQAGEFKDAYTHYRKAYRMAIGAYEDDD